MCQTDFHDPHPRTGADSDDRPERLQAVCDTEDCDWVSKVYEQDEFSVVVAALSGHLLMAHEHDAYRAGSVESAE